MVLVEVEEQTNTEHLTATANCSSSTMEDSMQNLNVNQLHKKLVNKFMVVD